MSLRDWPIKQKLTAMLVLISGLVLLLTSAAFAGYQYWSLRLATREALAVRGRIIAANSTASLAFANDADAREILSALRTDQHIVAAVLYDKGGHVFAAYPAGAALEVVPTAPGPDGYRFERGLLIGLQPVEESGSRRLGTLYLASDLGAIYDTFRLSGVIGLAVMAVALLAAYFLSRILQGAISQPILALAETAKAVSTRQDYSVRAPKLGADELGTLTDSFNQMLGRIAQQNDELQRHAADLERRVEERTHELQERNDALRRNAAELLAANTELDAFAYSVSHDLRAPLRSIDGFSQILLEDYSGTLDEAGQESLHRVRAASQRMGTLIDDLLKLARVTRVEIRTEDVVLSGMAREIAAELQRATPERLVEFAIAPGLRARGDASNSNPSTRTADGRSWSATTAPASTCSTPTSCSACSNACIPPPNSRAPASGSRRCAASSPGTAAASGPKGSWIGARPFTSLCEIRSTASEGLMNPDKIP